ncbi:MAG: hypothetical protein CL808_02840 [Citromicrobium sp.]|nr:hypothetical protein [Citromicrobium sp.]
MTRPIAFTMPALRSLDEGRLHHFRRLELGALMNLAQGDLLWVREPYFLERGFDDHKPTSAHAMGALPTFLDEVDYASRPPRLGRPRRARELLRDWHRRYLVVTEVRREPLQAITDEEIAAEGHADREAFAALWNANISATASLRELWAGNPPVLRVAFELVPTPLPAPAAIARISA